MRLADFSADATRIRAACAGIALALAAATPALANPGRSAPPPQSAAGADYSHDGHASAPRHGGAMPESGMPMPMHQGPMQPRHDDEMRARMAWIDECSDRLGGQDERRARDECERYLHDYYASYMRSGYGYPQPGYGYGCCQAQPAMMVPIRPVQGQPRCTETVEYVYEDVPAPRARPRTVPDKRIRVAPDKRIRY